MTGDAPARRPEPLRPNVGIIARREYSALVGSRLFHVSTIVLVLLAIFVAVLPILTGLLVRDTVTRVAIVASDRELEERSIAVLGQLLNQEGAGDEFALIPVSDADIAIGQVNDRGLDAVLVASRLPSGQLVISFHLGETMGESQIQKLSIGVFGVAVLDYSARNPVAGFQLPDVEILRVRSARAAARSRSTRPRSRAGSSSGS